MRRKSHYAWMCSLPTLAMLVLIAGCSHPATSACPRLNRSTKPAAKTTALVKDRTTSAGAPHADEREVVEAIERTGGRVAYSAAGRVIAVDLASCSETSHDLVDKLAALPSLERLDLAGTALRDAWMEEVAACKSLRRLSLRRTEVSDMGLKQLAKLPRLRDLDLGHTHVSATGLFHLTALSRLERLNLAALDLNDAGIAHLASLGQLRALALTDCTLTSEALNRLARLSALRELKLAGAKVAETPDAEDQTLVVRKLGNGDLAHLSALSQLVTLNLSRVAVTDEGLRHLAGLGRLKRLDLGGGWKDPEAVTVHGMSALVRLEQLEWLNLSGTAVTDEGIKQLSALRNLHSLRVPDTEVTGAGLEMLPALKRLDFGSSQTTREQVRVVGRLRGLRALNLGAAPVDPVWLKELGGMDQLEELTIDRVTFLEGGFDKLARFPRLRKLVLSGVAVPLTEEGLTTLASLKTLRELVMFGTVLLPRRTLDGLRQTRPDFRVALAKKGPEAND